MFFKMYVIYEYNSSSAFHTSFCFIYDIFLFTNLYVSRKQNTNFVYIANNVTSVSGVLLHIWVTNIANLDLVNDARTAFDKRTYDKVVILFSLMGQSLMKFFLYQTIYVIHIF